MPPWNAHSILLRFTNPPYMDENGFLQADHEGVINRWDIINAIEHAPWTTKQLYAMRAAEKNSRAKQFSAFNGWNNSYSYNPGDQHSITESDLWAKHRGYWYHHDGRPVIPIQKQFDRAIRLGNAVVKPIASLLRRARSHSALPRGYQPIEGGDDDDHDLPTPVPKKKLRRRATISRMSDNFQADLIDDVSKNDRDTRPSSRGPAWRRPSSKVHGLACSCWKCEEYRQFKCGRYKIPEDGSYDRNKGTGADNYSEAWDEWNNRADFIRKATKAPIETLDLRHRSSNRDPHRPEAQPAAPAHLPRHVDTRAIDPAQLLRPRHADHERSRPAHSKGADARIASGSRHTRYEQAMPSQRKQAAPARHVVPPAPVVPDHVAFHYRNDGLCNEEQMHWAKERADWKAARLQEVRDRESKRDRPSGGVIDDWRRATEMARPPREDRSKEKERPSRPAVPDDSARRDRPHRRHRHEESQTSRSHEVVYPIRPATPKTEDRRPDPAWNHEDHRQPPPAVLMQMEAMKRQRHGGLAPDQSWEYDDADPSDQRAFHRAQVAHLNRQFVPPVNPYAPPSGLPPRAPGRMKREERDARIAYLARDRPTTAEERAEMRFELARLAEARAQARQPEPRQRGRSRERTEARPRQPDYRHGGTRDPMADAELRRQGLLGYSFGPTSFQYDYVIDRLQDLLDTRPLPSSHNPAFPPTGPTHRPIPDPSRGPPPVSHARPRTAKPARDIGLGRPPTTRDKKVLPSLPSFPTLASSGEAGGPSRHQDQPSPRTPVNDVQTPPDDPPVRRRGRRGAYRSDQSDYSDGDDSPDTAPRAGDKGWREAYSAAQLAAKKQELKKVLEEYEELEAATARRERKRR